MTWQKLLVVIALILAIASFFIIKYPLVAVAVILLSVVLLA